MFLGNLDLLINQLHAPGCHLLSPGCFIGCAPVRALKRRSAQRTAVVLNGELPN